jgi:hypothetical protein
MTVQERQEQANQRRSSEPAPMTGLFRSARERQPEPGPSTESPLIQTGSPTNTAGNPAGAVVRQAVPDGGQRVAQPRQRFPNPGDQQQASGVAVARPSGSQPQRPGRDDRTVIYSSRPGSRVYYNNYYYYPRASYPYGDGSNGLGYFYYDPYGWYDNYYYDPYYPTYSYPSYGGGVYQYRYGYPTGEIRLQVRPRHAEVYVDGYYAGRVDDFDGFLQALRIEEGPHTIEIVAPGYETLTFNVRILPGRKIDYRGDLRPYRP